MLAILAKSIHLSQFDEIIIKKWLSNRLSINGTHQQY
jgi:hypothetical protein